MAHEDTARFAQYVLYILMVFAATRVQARAVPAAEKVSSEVEVHTDTKAEGLSISARESELAASLINDLLRPGIPFWAPTRTLALHAARTQAIGCETGTCLSTGPRLLSLDTRRSALLNAVLGSALGTDVQAAAVDWNTLASVNINALDYINALAAGLSVTPANVLTTNAQLLDFIDAAIAVFDQAGNNAVVAELNSLRAAMPTFTTPASIGELLTLDLAKNPVADLEFNLFELLIGQITLFNSKNVLTTPQPVALDLTPFGVLTSGAVTIEGVTVSAQLLEPMTFGCGDIGSSYLSSAVRLRLDVDLVDVNLAPTATATVSHFQLYVYLTRATAEIVSIDPLAPSVGIDATPGIGSLFLGYIPDANFYDRTTTATQLRDNFLSFGGIGTATTGGLVDADLQARASAVGDATIAKALTFSSSYPETQLVVGGADPVAALLADLIASLDLQAVHGPTTVDANALLAPVRGVIETAVSLVLTDIVDPLLELLGVGVNEQEVTLLGAFFADLDCDDDGIPNSEEGVDLGRDTDLDGYNDFLDRDSDSDGITDVTEAGGTDAGDGTLAGTGDADGNGLDDSVDPGQGSTPLPNVDSDLDGYANVIDIDADKDGIPDLVEAQPSMGPTGTGLILPAGTDTDGDGIDDAFDTDNGGAAITPYNFDGEDEPDYLDNDSDNDGASDLVEGHDMNEDGAINNGERTPVGSDTDQDGLDDGFEGEMGTSYTLSDLLNPANGIGAPPDDLPNNAVTGSTEEPDFRDGISTLPVELVRFDAILDGRAVQLTWETASETNNAGFEVQTQHIWHESTKSDLYEWDVMDFVEGHGTTLEAQRYGYRIEALEPGRYTFRLKQVDYEGTFDYSPEVEVEVGVGNSFVVEGAYPNPFIRTARLRFAVQQAQPVRAEVYNLLGQRVAVLLDGVVASGQMQTLEIDGSSLPNGLYLVRIEGERFTQVQRVTLLK